MASNPTGPGSGSPTGPRSGTKGVPRAERERQILDAATEEFGRRGYAGASLPAVAARVGVTKTLLHQYFGTKQDLWLACLTPAGDRLLAAVREAMAEGGADPRTPLRVLRAVFTALEGRREAWFVLYDPSLPPDGEAARRAAYYRDAIDALAATGSDELLRATARAPAPAPAMTPPPAMAPAPRGAVGGPVDDETLRLDADALKYAWRGLVTALVRWWISHPGESPDAMARRCARLFAAAGAAFAADDET